MALMDLYRSLTEEQRAHLAACRSLAEILAYLKAEGITLTEDHLEAISGCWAIGWRRKPADAIPTGLYGKFFAPSEEWGGNYCTKPKATSRPSASPTSGRSAP